MDVANAKKAQMQLAREMRGRWVGPFPIPEFLNLVPPPSAPLLSYPETIFHSIPQGEPEHMYPALVSALQILNLKNLNYTDTSNHAHGTAPSYEAWKLGISTYSFNFTSENRKDSTYGPTTSGKRPAPSQTYMPDLLHFELKLGHHDPFCDNPQGPDDEFESATYIETHGHIAAVLNDLFSRSFRTHAFAVFMDGHIARLFRADRAGVLVSKAFDYRTHPEHLVGFLHRLNDATPGQRGFDTTVDCNHKEIEVPNSGLLDYTKVKLEGCLSHTESLTNGGRRVFRVRNPRSGQIGILKDGWRENLPGVTAEWDVVAELNKARVPHIPKLLCGGVVQGEHHCTLADQYSLSGWRVGPGAKLIPRVHYRFIEEDAGKSLTEVGSAKELAQVLADVIEALWGAWDRCRYVHRDVSSTNVMITADGRGVLIDWEFGEKVPLAGEQSQKTVRATDRPGTWFYLSSALLRYPGKSHSPLDDLQSVLWVAVETALNHLDHDSANLPRVALALLERDYGGDRKLTLLFDPPRINFTGNPAFSALWSHFFAQMWLADLWEVRLVKPPRLGSFPILGPKPSDVPNHSKVLEIFRRCLDRPDDEWSEKRNVEPRLWRVMEQLKRETREASDDPISKRALPRRGVCCIVNPRSEVLPNK